MSESTNKCFLFLFGIIIGFFYSKTYTSAFALWLQRLHNEPGDFITRSNVLHNVGVQVLTACIFQVQMALLDCMLQNNFHSIIEAFFLFGPILCLSMIGHLIAICTPFPADSKFSWPVPTPFTFTIKMALKFLSSVTPFSVDELAFATFSDYKVSHFARHLPNNTRIQGGPSIEPYEYLSPESLELHLRQFDSIGSSEQWWQSTAKLSSILMNNSECFSKRLDLIDSASSSICIVTWSLTGTAGRVIVDKLLQRNSEGVAVKVIVDAAVSAYLS